MSPTSPKLEDLLAHVTNEERCSLVEGIGDVDGIFWSTGIKWVISSTMGFHPHILFNCGARLAMSADLQLQLLNYMPKHNPLCLNWLPMILIINLTGPRKTQKTSMWALSRLGQFLALLVRGLSCFCRHFVTGMRKESNSAP